MREQEGEEERSDGEAMVFFFCLCGPDFIFFLSQLLLFSLSLSRRDALDTGPEGEGSISLCVQQQGRSGDERDDAEEEECRSSSVFFVFVRCNGDDGDDDDDECSTFQCVVGT